MRPKGLFLGKILKEAGSKQHILGDVTHSEKNKKQFIVFKISRSLKCFNPKAFFAVNFFGNGIGVPSFMIGAEKKPWQVVGDIEKDGIKVQILFENSAKRKQKTHNSYPLVN